MSNVDVHDPAIGLAYKEIMSGTRGDSAWLLLRYSDSKVSCFFFFGEGVCPAGIREREREDFQDLF